MKRLIFWGIVVASLWYFFGHSVNPVNLLKQLKGEQQGGTANVGEATISIGYVLEPDKWTQFSIPPESQRLRILTNANFSDSFNPQPEKRWWYQLQYQILDKDDNILADRSYHFHTRLTKYTDPNTQEILFPRFYLHEHVIPGDGRTMLLNLADIENAASIRFRTVWKDPAVVDVLARTYFEEKTSERKLGYLWHKLSKKSKARLAKGNVYPSYLLTDQEKQHLLRTMWQPIGPVGIEGSDYTLRHLYTLKEAKGDRDTGTQILPEGLFIDSIHRGIIPLPDTGGTILLEFTGLDDSPSDKEEAIHIRWFGAQSFERAEHSILWAGDQTRFEQIFPGGLLEIETTCNVVVRAFLVEENRQEEITPDPLYVRTHVTRQGMPVTFELSHLPDFGFRDFGLSRDRLKDFGLINSQFAIRNSQSAIPNPKYLPFRVDFRYQLSDLPDQEGMASKATRSLLPAPCNLYPDLCSLFPVPCRGTEHRAPTPRSLPTIRYQLLNAEGNIAQEGEILLSEEVSLYDSLSENMDSRLISEPVRRFFSLPPQIVRIRFIAEHPVLITAYTRPPDLVKHTRVPEDYDKYRLKDDARQPTWFSLQPVEHQQLVVQNRSLSLNVQYRPPEDNPEISFGQYQWESYSPEGSWEGRYLLTPRDPRALVREEMLAVLYHQVSVGKETVLHFKTPAKGGKTIRPKLFFLRKAIDRVPLEIFLDGQPYYSITLSGTRGELRLPPLSPGTHHVNVVAPEDVACYLSHTDSTTPSLLKRFGTRLDQAGLTFLYEKKHAEQETVLLHFFAPIAHDQPTNMRVTIEAEKPAEKPCVLDPLADWTLLERRYIIRPQSGVAVPVLHTHNEFVDQGRLFFLPLGSDLPPGRYAIRVNLEKGTEKGYLIVSKITPGSLKSRSFSPE